MMVLWSQGCPAGFKHIPEAGGYYKVVLEALNWDQSRARCAQFDPRAHLVVITSEQQNEAIVNYLKTFDDSSVYNYNVFISSIK